MKHITTLCLTLLLALPSIAQMPSLEDAFKTVGAYEFSENRMALTVIEEAVATTEDPAALEQRLLAVLAGDATDDAKRFVCRMLSWIGSDASVDAMTNLLDNPEIAGHAKLVLRNIRMGTMLLRGEYPDDCDTLVRLFHMLDPKKEDRVFAALDDLMACAEAALASGDSEFAAGVYDECYKSNYPEHIRAAGLVGRIKLDPDNALATVEEAMTTGGLLRACLPYVRSTEGKKASKSFADALSTIPDENKAAYIAALADRKDPSTAKAIATQTESDVEEVCIAALYALGKVGGGDDIPLLLDLRVNSEGETKRAAQESLLRITDPSANKVLLKIGNSGTDEINAAAIQALGDRRALEQKDDVLKLLSAKDNDIRKAALDALRVIASPDDLDTLIALLGNDDYDEQRRALESAIATIAQRITEPENQADAVIAALQDADSSAYAASLLRLLSSTPNAKGLVELKKALDSKDETIRLAAIKSMSSWPNADPIPSLVTVVEAAQSEAEVDAAVGGMVELLNAINPRTPDLLASYKAMAGHLTSNGDMNKFLSGVGTLATTESFDLIQPFLSNEKTNASAALATTRVALALSGAMPDLAKEKVSPFLADTYPEPVRQQAQTVLDTIERNGNYLMAWELAGPYMIEGKPAMSFFDHEFQPLTDPDNAPWRIMPPASRPDQVGVLDLAEVIGGFERVAYLRTTLTATEDTTATFLLGTNDGCKVWLNGEVLEAINFGRGLKAGEDVLPLKLNKGDNTLMVAVSQHGGAWAMIAQLKNDKGVTAHIN